MKSAVAIAYTFTPASKTVDLSGISGFDVKKLYAIINITANQLIYAVGQAPYGFAGETSGVVTLVYDTTGMNAADELLVIYDQDGVGDRNDTAATSDTGTFSLISLFKRFIQRVPVLGQAAKAASTPVALATEQVGSAGSAAADVLSVQGITSMTPLKTDGSDFTQPISATALPLPAGAATEATLASIDGKLNEVTQNGQAATVVTEARRTATRTRKRLYGSLTNTTNGTPVTLQIAVEGGAAANDYTVTAASELILGGVLFSAYSTANSDIGFTLEIGVNNVWTVLTQGVVGKGRVTTTAPITFPDLLRLAATETLAFRVTQDDTSAGLYSISLSDAYEIPA